MRKRTKLLILLTMLVSFALLAGAVFFGPVLAGIDDGVMRQLPGGLLLNANLVYADVNGQELRLDVLRLEGPSEQLRPIAVFIHGGAWRSGDKLAGGRYLLPLVQAGYLGFSINYRLSRQAVFPAQIHDCKAAIRWIRAHATEFGGDPERIAVFGTSAGGHLAALLGTSGGVPELEGDVGDYDDVSSEVQVVADWFGPADLTTMGANLSEWHVEVVSGLLGGSPEEVPELYAAASPASHIDAGDPPVLIIHGDADTKVPVEQSRTFAAALADAGVPVEYIEVPGGGHGNFIFTDPDLGDLLERMIEYFDSHLEREGGGS